jgi:4-amino-4-deoxy-L-arabinose transferase-like glycosyltransferase
MSPAPTSVGEDVAVVVPSRRTFTVSLGAIVLFGALVRVVYVEVIGPHARLFADSGWYYAQAANIRRGVGYVDIARQIGFWNGHAVPHELRATAYWPPAYPTFLAGVQVLFGTSIFVARVAGAATGAATILLTGLLGRAIARERVGLVAAALVAVSPLVVAIDGSLMSETLYLPLVLLALLLAQYARNRPSVATWCALGAVTGLAALARDDAILLVVFVMIPTALLALRPARETLSRLVLGVLVLGAVITPWLVRNAVRVGQPALSTVSPSWVVAGANCGPTYRGAAIGDWVGDCAQPQLGFRTTEIGYADHERSRGLSYAFHHVGRWPTVVSARVARVWGLWNPVNQARYDHVESRNRVWQELMWPVSLVLLGLGAVGLRLLARHGRQIAMLVAPIAMTTLVAVVGYGNTRFRGPAECALAVAAAALLVHLWDRWTRRPSPVSRFPSRAAGSRS